MGGKPVRDHTFVNTLMIATESGWIRDIDTLKKGMLCPKCGKKVMPFCSKPSEEK